MGDVIAAYRETFMASLNSGKAEKSWAPQRGRPAALVVLCSGCGAAFALSFAPNGRYVRCERGRRRAEPPVASLGCRILNHRVPSLALPAHGEGGTGSSSRQFPMKKLGIFVAGAIVFSSAAHAYDYKVGAL